MEVLLGLGPGVQALAADASLLLLVGGLSMLGLIMVLVGLQSLFPERPRESGPQPGRHRARQLRPLREDTPLFAELDKAPRPGPFRREEYHLPVDHALAHVVELQLGEPRILRTLRGMSRIRLYRCRGCEPDVADKQAGCTFERQGLQKAFRAKVNAAATVREVRCRTRGAEVCEFEVRH